MLAPYACHRHAHVTTQRVRARRHEASRLLMVRTKSLGQSMEITVLDVLDGIIRFDL
jgi:hypothetical protein